MAANHNGYVKKPAKVLNNAIFTQLTQGIMRVGGFALFLLCAAAAQSTDFTYTIPSAYEDGSPLPLSEIAESRLYCNGALIVSEPSADGTFSATLSAGTNSCYATVLSTNGLEGNPGNIEVVVIPGPAPSRPTWIDDLLQNSAAPPPSGIQRIVGIGDSWVDRFQASCTEGFNPMWNEVLRDNTAANWVLHAKCGAWTDAIDRRVDNYIASGVQPGDHVFYWFFLNDFNAAGNTIEQHEFDAISQTIRTNLISSFTKINSSGSQLTILTMPQGRQVPLMMALGQQLCDQNLLNFLPSPCTPEGAADAFLEQVDDMIYDAATSAGVFDKVYNMKPFFQNFPPGWLPAGKHFDAQTNVNIANHLQAVFWQ